jgi:hypothetical protein
LFEAADRPAGAPRGRWHPSEDAARFHAAPTLVPKAQEAGAVLVGGREHPVAWTAAEHAARVARLSAALSEPPRAETDVVVLHRPWHEAGARTLLTWCEAAEAATLFEPDTDFGWSTAVWARPTILAASPLDWLRWEPWLAQKPASSWVGPRRPFGRLRALLTLSAQGEAAELPAAWRALAELRGATLATAG